MTTRLYHHKTDGGAEYLCLKPVEGTDEGDMRTAVIRLDGDPEFINGMYPHDMYNRIVTLEYVLDCLTGCVDSQECNGYIGIQMLEESHAAIRAAEGE